MPALGDIVLHDGDLPSWLEPSREYQINHYAEHIEIPADFYRKYGPDALGSAKERLLSHVYSRRRRLIDLGLRGGYGRRWHGKEREYAGSSVLVAITLLEWPDADTAVEDVRSNGHEKSLPSEPDLDGIQVSVGSAFLRSFIAAGRLSCTIEIMKAPRLQDDEAHATLLFELTKKLAVAQRNRMQTSDL